MSRIDDLVNELAPKGVQYKTLSELGTITRGKRFVKSDIVEFGVPCIHYGEIYMKYGNSTTKTFSYLSPEQAARLRSAHPGDVIIASAGETVEDIGKAVAWLGDEDVVIHDACYAFRSKLEPKYVVYFFQTDEFHDQIRKYISSSKISAISTKNLGKVRIPVPPVEVQREIVRVLDLFGGLAANLATELDAELEARQLQYAHYLDELFALRGVGSIKRVPMGEVGKFIRGRRFTKSDVVDKGIPSVHYGEIYTTYGITTTETVSHVREDLAPQLRYAKPGDVIIAAVGETVEDVGKAVAWLGTTDIAIHDDCFLYRSAVLEPAFVAYYLRTEVLNREKARYVARAKVKRLSGESLAKLVIPVPSLGDQKRIVAVLDKFDALVTDLSAALPAEVTARRKQYEHYRDRLLTFKELAA